MELVCTQQYFSLFPCLRVCEEPEGISRYKGIRQCNRFLTLTYSFPYSQYFLSRIPSIFLLRHRGTLGDPSSRWESLNASTAGSLALQSGHSDKGTVWTHRNQRGFSSSVASGRTACPSVPGQLHVKEPEWRRPLITA